jgi:hypothetical protein
MLLGEDGNHPISYHLSKWESLSGDLGGHFNHGNLDMEMVQVPGVASTVMGGELIGPRLICRTPSALSASL